MAEAFSDFVYVTQHFDFRLSQIARSHVLATTFSRESVKVDLINEIENHDAAIFLFLRVRSFLTGNNPVCLKNEVD